MKECIDGWAASPGNLHPATLARYNRCRGLVETVIRDVYNKEDVAFSELDRKFITAFERYLKETCGLARNTAAKYLECFRKVLKVARQKGWMEDGKCLKELGRLCVKEETSPSFLDWEELRTVMETDMPAGRLERVKDVFVFCALTGLSYQGVSTLVRRTCSGMTKEHCGFAGHVLKERRLETAVQAVFLFLNRQWSCWRNTEAGIR